MKASLAIIKVEKSHQQKKDKEGILRFQLSKSQFSRSICLRYNNSFSEVFYLCDNSNAKAK
jgi:HSP20 family molecular chaperone IbpA